MLHPDDVSLMARFVKLLGDRGRLAILGLLAVRSRSFEELSEEIPSVSATTIKRHLHLLEDAEWAVKGPDGRYALRSDALTALRAALARMETAPARSPESSETILRTYFDKEGRLRGLPSQSGRLELALRHVADRCFAVGRSYDEQEIDNLLIPMFEDSHALKRALLSAGILEGRDGRYWLSLKKPMETHYP